MVKDLTAFFPDILRQIGAIADAQGIQVFVVGGYLRDLLLTKDGNRSRRCDLDFTVVGEAVPFVQLLQQKLGARNIIVYEQFGTAMLELADGKLEFVTARTESYLQDSRKPRVVKANLESDLSRRDFTINAMAVGLNSGNWGQFYDPYQGLADLQMRMLRTPLDPEMTFSDDPLRILRAVRFATVLDFQIVEETQAAIQKMAPRLEIIANERITDELFKMLTAAVPSKGFLLLDKMKILPYVFPELVEMKGVEQRNEFHHKDVFFHSMKVIDNVAQASDQLPLRFAALLHDVAKPRTKRFDDQVGWTFHGHDEIGARMMEDIAQRMRLSNRLKEYVQKLIRLHLRPIFLATEEVTDSAIRRLIIQAGDDLADLIILCRADITSGNPQRVREHLKNFDFVMKRVLEVTENDKLRSFQSPVRGDKIMAVCGIPPSPLVGRIKKAIEEAILDGKIPNEYDAALNYLCQIKDQFVVQSETKN